MPEGIPRPEDRSGRTAERLPPPCKRGIKAGGLRMPTHLMRVRSRGLVRMDRIFRGKAAAKSLPGQTIYTINGFDVGTVSSYEVNFILP
mgnify:CR=1 FL=1